MKLILFTFAILFLIPAFSVYAQTLNPDGGGAIKPPSDELTELRRIQISKTIRNTIDSLEALGKIKLNKAIEVKFDWPIKLADHVFDYGVHGISNFVDHNFSYPGKLKDYNCNERTYDTDSGYNHAGTDIFIWPNQWKKMNDNDVEIIAAASGTIVGKYDGNFDKNCSFNESNWNAIYILHDDSTVAWYGHMKKGSLTDKQIGETIERGEYLGVVGSSGNSTGPHLHFEVHNINGSILDPYKGTCNAISESLWKDQKPYYDSKINAVRTHDEPPQFYFESCGKTEEPNFQDAFLIGDFIIFAAYYRDQLKGQVSSYSIVDPNETTINSWQASSTEEHYAGSYWFWEQQVPEGSSKGVWEFRVNFTGNEYVHRFTVSDLATKPIVVPLFFPYNNEILDNVAPTLRWLPLADADTYHIQVAFDDSFSNIILEKSTITEEKFETEISEMGSFYWRVRAENEHGTGEWSEIWRFNLGESISTEMDANLKPFSTHLLQNYPNPFNPSTRISFRLNEPAKVSVVVYDLLGREIEIVTSAFYKTGTHNLDFNAGRLTTGVYLYQIKTDKFIEVRRMTLIK